MSVSILHDNTSNSILYRQMPSNWLVLWKSSIETLAPLKGPGILLDKFGLSNSTMRKFTTMQAVMQLVRGTASKTLEQKCFSFRMNCDSCKSTSFSSDNKPSLQNVKGGNDLKWKGGSLVNNSIKRQLKKQNFGKTILKILKKNYRRMQNIIIISILCLASDYTEKCQKKYYYKFFFR